METTLGKILYNILISIPVSFCLAFVGEALDGNINWLLVLLNFCITYVMNIAIGLFVPLGTIGASFTHLFHGRTDTYKGNIKYRLLSTLAISTVYFVILNPTSAFINSVIISDTISVQAFLLSWAINIIPMFLTGFLSTLPSDYFAYHAAKKVAK